MLYINIIIFFSIELTEYGMKNPQCIYESPVKVIGETVVQYCRYYCYYELL